MVVHIKDNKNKSIAMILQFCLWMDESAKQNIFRYDYISFILLQYCLHFMITVASKFEPLATVLCSLKDEIAALRAELAQLKQLNVDNASSNADSTCVNMISDVMLISSDIC